MSPDFGSCAMTAHPHQPVFILPKKVSASSDTTDVSPDMAARHHDTNNNNRNGILSLLLSVIMLVKPSLVSAQANQPQGPVKEPQKIEQSAVDQSKLNQELMNSIMRGNVKRVEELVSQGADCNVNYHGFIPLNFAIQRGHKDVAIFLIEHGALVNRKDNSGRTPLSYIIEANPDELSEYSDIIQLLLDNGADVVAADRQGLTLMHKAAAAGNKEIILLLLTHGAAVDAKDSNGRTLLHYAAGAPLPGMESRSNPDLVQLLLNKDLAADIDVNVQDKYGMTPLHNAASAGYIDIVKLLIAQWARLDIKDNSGRAAIHYAAEAAYAASKPQKWSVGMVQLLIDAGADINVKDGIGWTPLHYAAYHFKKYLIEVLVERGADVDVVDNHGRTPHVLMHERAVHLETLRGSAFEATVTQALKRDLRKELREISRLLYRNGCIYVVATNGKDTNPGTRKSPLRTIAAAIEVVRPGDVILVRGGTYVCSRTIHIDKSGEQGNPIRLAAYPGEVAVFDFAEAKGNSVFISGAYWHIEGLAITRAMRPMMIHGSGAHHNILEQVRAFGNYFGAIYISSDGPAHNIILNCDAYRNFDPHVNGQSADGFVIGWNVGRGNILIGNRSWNNSDDGYDCWYAGNSVRFERCYAWRNGENIWEHPLFTGNGNGFKLGKGEGRHILINCVAWKHYHRGFDLNANTEGVILRNCTGWGNVINYFFETNRGGAGNILRNNVSYGGRDSIGARVDSQFNSWDADLGLKLTDDDFASLDDSMMSAPRNPDGSIPQNDFLKLAPTSVAIDKGADIGMPFVGKRPDLGAFEYGPNAPSQGYVKMLHQYVRDRDIKKIKELLIQGESINDKDWLGYTPLQWAVYFGYPDVVELLLSQGADPDIQSDTGRFTLEIAKAMVYADIEALLNKHKAAKDTPTVTEENSPEAKEDKTQAKTEKESDSQSPDMTATQVTRASFGNTQDRQEQMSTRERTKDERRKMKDARRITQDEQSPDMAAKRNDGNNNRGGILSLLLSLIMLVKPSLASAQASQPQGPVKEPQKVTAPQKDTAKSSEVRDAPVLSESPYLRAVREFADNVLTYGRDTYGPKHTPLFVDGVNVNTHEPVKWISPKGDVLTATETEEWILSNFASQQTLLRTLDGLSAVTGDPKYRDAAMQATKYAFENLRAPNGLFYWGHCAAYDAQNDKIFTSHDHSLKINYPYYELLWQVDSEATERYIEAFWSAHIIDWSNLDFCRNSVPFRRDSLELSWDHEYKEGGPTFFISKRSSARGFLSTATSLIHAGTTLYRCSDQALPFVWSKRLMQRFINIRNPKTGVTANLYNRPRRIFPNKGMEGHFADAFPHQPFQENIIIMNFGENWQPLAWVSLLLVGDSLDEQGREFTQWALEELTAWGKASYRERDNSFVPILTDGTNIEGVILEESCELGIKGDSAVPRLADPKFFWLYATAYQVTGDGFMWQMTRNIGIGNDFGNIGDDVSETPELNTNTTCSDVYGLLGFLELYNRTSRTEFLSIARKIADNILARKFHKGFFISSKQHIYSRFDCFEPLALLHLIEALDAREFSVPLTWPTCTILASPYRFKSGNSTDRWLIYRLTESSEVPWSLAEAAHIGDINKIKSLINSGVDVDSWDTSVRMTALHRAAIRGNKEVVQLLCAHGANVNIQGRHWDGYGYTPLHYAVKRGHKEVAEILLDYGANVNAKSVNGQTPLDIALNQGNKEIIKLLLDKGALLQSIHAAAAKGV